MKEKGVVPLYFIMVLFMLYLGCKFIALHSKIWSFGVSHIVCQVANHFTIALNS